MKLFSQLFSEMEATNKTNDKLALLTEYFRNAPSEDAIWVLYFLIGRRPRRVIPSRRLAAWACALADVPDWLFAECHDVVGDLAETIALLLPDHSVHSELPLHRCIEAGLFPLAELEEEGQRSLVVGLWGEMDATQRFLYNKLITGEFRFGVSQGLVVRSLANVSGIEPAMLSHRLMGHWEPTPNFFTQLLGESDDENLSSRPYPFFLAQPLSDDPQSLGDVAEWQAEWKWDGIRAQLIRRKGTTFLWSRGEEIITDRFPEIRVAGDQLPDGTVLDGEILPYKEDQVLPFAELQRRIGRKEVGNRLLKDVPVVLMSYDLLELNGVDVRSQPLSERRKWLEALLRDDSDRGPLLTSPLIMRSSWEELAEVRGRSRSMQVEGIMLKHRDSPYRVGRGRGDWWKWKIEPLTMDAVLILAQRGSGKRASLFTDYTFGVWQGGELVPVAKAYSGLTDEEIRRVDRFVRHNTIGKFGPVRVVKPELVFELGFEAIAKSSRHKSGIAVRFPRMLRWRVDKPIEEADRMETLLAMLALAAAKEAPARESSPKRKSRREKESDMPLFEDLE